MQSHVYALERAKMVGAWYSRRIDEEYDRPAPDRELIGRLYSELGRCLNHQRELTEAKGDRLLQLADFYARKYAQLTHRAEGNQDGSADPALDPW